MILEEGKSKGRRDVGAREREREQKEGRNREKGEGKHQYSKQKLRAFKKLGKSL